MSDDPLDTLSDDELEALPDSVLGDLTGSAILAAAVMTGSRWADQYHARVDRAYAECAKRKRGIYQRAFNQVAIEQGHSGMVEPIKAGIA